MDQVHLSSAGPPFLFSLRVALTALLAEQELIAPLSGCFLLKIDCIFWSIMVQFLMAETVKQLFV